MAWQATMDGGGANGDAAARQDSVQAVAWEEDAVRLLDQRRLPGAERYLSLSRATEVAEAIRDMVVRGAPAIGIAAAYAVVLAARAAWRCAGTDWRQAARPELQRLERARPTAVHLRWAVRRMRDRFAAIPGEPTPALLAEARALHREDMAANRRIGALGADFIGGPARVLTHCNAGALATGGYGTALGVVRSLHARGALRAVYVCESRPWLQGARLTAWELQRDGIPVTLIADAAAPGFMARGEIDWVVVGADRIAANGDVVNKIGTYAHAVAARHHGLGFLVAASAATIDAAMATGAGIPIERRAPEELLAGCGWQRLPPGIEAANPVFDLTPAALVGGIVTERGVVAPPGRDHVRALLAAEGGD
ncbi:MAG: S-methyl-5-thioribose-1-phosphate isomerase [Gammaproteobacteria bacterium]|nr:S-methyl-5-thioribose-1-phosphate isomerase [Gammaproteobacteria bacterium]